MNFIHLSATIGSAEDSDRLRLLLLLLLPEPGRFHSPPGVAGR